MYGGGRTLRSGRVFYTRLLLSLDFSVSIDTTYSLTKTESVKDIYCLIYKLLDCWTVYEALLRYAENLKIKSQKDTDRYNWIQSISSIESVYLILWRFLDLLTINYRENKSFASSFDNYIHHLYAQVKPNLAKSIFQISEYIQGTVGNINCLKLLDLIYAERNAYFHNGDCARMGAKYSFRKFILSQYIALLIDVITCVGTCCFRRERNSGGKL